MKHEIDQTTEATELRRLAEERLKNHPADPRVPTADATMRRLLHEMRLHQIEVEIQSEQIRELRSALDAAAARFTEFYDFAPNGFLTLTKEGAITHANLAAAQILDIERGSLLGMPLERFVAAADHPTLSEFLRDVFATATKQTCELTLALEGRSIRFVQVSAIINRDGKECREVLVDITDRKRTAELLRTSKQLTEDILASLSDHTAVLDANGVIVSVNEAWASFAAANGAEGLPGVGIGANYLDTCRSAGTGNGDAAMALAGIQSVLDKSAASFHMEYECSSPNKRRWFHMSVTPLRSPSGGAVVIHRNTTEDKRVVAALRESENRLSLAVTAADLGIFEHDHASDTTVMSPTLRRIVGWTENEPTSLTSYLEKIHPDDSPDVIATIQRAQDPSGTGEYRIDHRIVLRDGGVRWIRILGRTTFGGKDGERHPVSTVGIVEDVTAGKNAEQKLRQNELLLRLAMTAANMGAWRWDIAAHQTTYSTELSKLFGLPEGAGVTSRDTFLNRIHQDDRESFDATIRMVLDGNAPYEMDYRVVWPDGSVHWLASRGQVQHDKDGKPTSVVGVVTEITDRVNKEIALREADEFNRQIVGSAQEGIVVLDLDFRYRLWNPFMNALSGLPENQVVGRHPWDLFEFLPKAEVQGALQRAMAGETVVLPDTFANAASPGKSVWVSQTISPLRNATGAIIGIIGTIADTTVRKRAEEALRYNESQLSGIIGSAMDGIITIDEDQKIVLFNAAAEQLFGYSRNQVIGQSIDILIPEPNRAPHTSHVQAFVKTGVTTRKMGEMTPVVGLRSDGRRFPMEASISQINVAGERFLTAIVRDITERLQREGQIRDYANRLRILSQKVLQAQESERRRLAGELHDEIGQVLCAVSVNLKLVKTKADESLWPRLSESIQIVDEAIGQVRNMSLDLRPVILDDFGLASALRWYVDRMIARTELRIHLTTEPDAPIMSPETRVACFRIAQEALTNVVRHASAQEVWVDLVQGQTEVTLTIRDDGKGFDVPTAHLRASKGDSLGLLGMQERVELRGGKISLQSSPGSGTIVLVQLPLDHP